MRLTQRLFIIVFSFLTSAFSGYYFFVHLEKPNVALSVAGLIASGFFFGLLQGWLFGAAAYKAVKLGAFLGVLLLWIPRLSPLMALRLSHYLF
ncbi:hypothetical protein ACFOLJ_20215 [Rugamonas sp. CCM 8940]|uniref:hypothetical protein n=1 Tax=Rugamonas sp. CCM 8940 TaxID=2765359 RepID=UPI00360B2295